MLGERPTDLTLRWGHAASLYEHFTEGAIKERFTGLSLPSPKAVAFAAHSTTAIASHLTELELAQQTTLALHDPGLELVL